MYIYNDQKTLDNLLKLIEEEINLINSENFNYIYSIDGRYKFHNFNRWEYKQNIIKLVDLRNFLSLPEEKIHKVSSKNIKQFQENILIIQRIGYNTKKRNNKSYFKEFENFYFKIKNKTSVPIIFYIGSNNTKAKDIALKGINNFYTKNYNKWVENCKEDRLFVKNINIEKFLDSVEIELVEKTRLDIQEEIKTFCLAKPSKYDEFKYVMIKKNNYRNIYIFVLGI